MPIVKLDEYGNTILHMALLERNTEEALRLVKIDEKLPSEDQLINAVALNNTPLILALKTGNIKVALAILEHPEVDINIPDYIGMRAIHWAAFLRIDDVIEKLLKLNAETQLSPTSGLQGPISRSELRGPFARINASDFYREDLVSLDKLSVPDRIHLLSSPILPLFALLRMRSNFQYEPGYFKSDVSKRAKAFLNDLMHIPLHAVAFHIDLFLANNSIESKQELDASYTSSSGSSAGGTKSYKKNFIASYDVFCEFRNSIPVNEEILSVLEKSEQIAIDKLIVKPK